MFQQLKSLIGIGAIAVVGYFIFFGGDSGEQTADLGQVLDRTEYVMLNYQNHLEENNIETMGDQQIEEFTQYYMAVLNADPRFYDSTLGLSLQEDGSFLGYADGNSNGFQDNDEGKVFTVEIDEENRRLIATDVAGQSAGMQFSGTGFLAGALLGHFLARQRGAGINRGAFNNRTVADRSSYKAPSSARSKSRSGGLRAGK
jgi:hypothetical protein